jgi:hypothetical protein
MYTRRLQDPQTSLGDAATASPYLQPQVLCEIWVFADIRSVPALGNAAIDMFHERITATWTTAIATTACIYEKTLPGAHLRRFLVDSCALTKDLVGFETLDADETSIHFLLEVFPTFIRRGANAKSIGRPAYTKLCRCQWHDHSGPGGKLRLDSRK